ncbi:Lysosomal Pro-X carboxypeptidase [Echinococcus granulosus]|uniref:Lysosomal Pro-X carboxypeptidase n=1 Tax=Echinococcus granulosus TaxID=6210 RepID=W6UKZ5_ECHGR|nr:Lysosomal Pro-X carboxypeptidase [Echinococcus granulosus]EUB62200.1 Lysosomal Pro-X carboxypeptidase [Echinococcus granulosus]
MAEKSARSLYPYERRNFTEFVDHFSFAPSQEFNLTYLISTEEWKPGGPILFYTGNEGLIDHFAQNTGFMFELAKILSGAVIFAEHRYYGTSLPFGSRSFLDRNHFGFLTAEQALADYAKFISDFKCANRQFSNSPVISFGGSYGGMLTAWFRQAYPNIVAGGLASSAPIWLFPGMADCRGFYQVTTRAYRQAGGDTCISTIREVWSLMDDIAAERGLASLSGLFKTCRPFPNGDFIYEFTKDYLITLAMANYPYSASFLGNLPAWPVKVCSFRISYVEYIRSSEENCLSFDGNSTNLDAKGWELQTCMEMTNPICSDGKSDMFKPSTWDPIEFSNACQRKFGVRPRMGWAGVQWWAKNLYTVTRLIFSNGDLDPWSAFGVLEKELVPGATVVRIASGAHHLDLRGSHPNDTAEVRAARSLITNHINSWINAWHREAHPLYCLDF